MSGSRGDNLTLAPELARVFAALRALPAYEQAFACRRLVAELTAAASALRQRRREAVQELRDVGLSLPEIADLLDLTPSSVHDLTTDRSKRRREQARKAAQAAAARPVGDPPDRQPAQPPGASHGPPSGP